MSDNIIKCYQAGLNREREKILSENAAENVVNFYQNNKEICDLAYTFYDDYKENINKYVKKPTMTSEKNFQSYLCRIKILVLTANPIECGVLLKWLSQKNTAPLDTYLVNSHSYNVFKVNEEQCIIHMNQYKTGEEYTRRAINNAAKLFKPNYICLIGICYGLNILKHSIGSVFISDSITTFRLNFRDQKDSDDVAFEAEEEYAQMPSNDMMQTIKSKLLYTSTYSILSNSGRPTIALNHIGKFLSSNSLMSSCKVKKAILNAYGNTKPQPLGGEMEGAGILKSYIVEEEKTQKWVIIKSICDWGEKKNALSEDACISDKIKDSLQAFAMTNSCGVFEELLDIFI